MPTPYKDRISWHREYYKKNKKYIKKRSKIYVRKRVQQWYKWLKKEYGYPVKCALCEIKLYFGHSNKRKVPHFDHKRGKLEAIGHQPSSMFRLKMTRERQKLFKSCKFGILCDKCNKGLTPDLKKRRLIVKNLVKYIGV